MPKYLVTLSDGRKFQVEADGQPSESDILAHLDPKPEAPAAPAAPAESGYEAMKRETFDRLTGHNAPKMGPVAASAMVGGMLAAPLTGAASIPAAMAAAGLGGAGGAGLAIAGRQLASGRPESGIETAKTMGAQGVGQALGAGAGGVVSGAADKAVPAVLKGIVRPSKGLQQEFPDIVQTMRAERIPVGQSAKAGARAEASGKEADALVAAAEARGAPPIQTKELHPGLREVNDTMAQRVRLGMPDERPVLTERAQALYRENPGGISLTDAQGLKREAQGVASRTYKALDRGSIVNDTGALTDKAIAGGLRKSIEARVPEVGPVNARTQSLMGLERALEDAESRSGGITGLNPLNWLGSLIPGVASHGAFAADTAARGMTSPPAALIRQALLAMLAGDGTQQ